jgi:regulator of sigma D
MICRRFLLLYLIIYATLCCVIATELISSNDGGSSNGGIRPPVSLNLTGYTNGANTIIFYELINMETDHRAFSDNITINGILSKFLAFSERQNLYQSYPLLDGRQCEMHVEQDGPFRITCTNLGPQEKAEFNFSIYSKVTEKSNKGTSCNCSFLTKPIYCDRTDNSRNIVDFKDIYIKNIKEDVGSPIGNKSTINNTSSIKEINTSPKSAMILPWLKPFLVPALFIGLIGLSLWYCRKKIFNIINSKGNQISRES